ncbi:MAG: hypothetical protein ACI38Q_08765 [Candidatus Bruticola sp.]
MFRLNLFKVTALFFAVWALFQIVFIFEGKISSLGPSSKADKTLVFQGHADKDQVDNRLSKVSASTDKPQITEPAAKMGLDISEAKVSNTGNVAVGFGENAPHSVPQRVGMPKMENSDSMFVGKTIQPAVHQGAPKQIFHKNIPGAAIKGEHSKQIELNAALNSGQSEQTDQQSPQEQAQLSMQMAQAHLQSNKEKTANANMSSPALRPGYSDEYMQALQRQDKQRISNNYERCLAAIIFLEGKGGSLALTPAQARCVLKLIEEAENDRYAEENTLKKLNELLSKDQKVYISKHISRRPLYANGPAEEDPTAASLQKAITALSGKQP